MADFLARQRVALHDGSTERAYTNVNRIYVQITDGTNNLSVNSAGSMVVSVSNLNQVADGDYTSTSYMTNIVGGVMASNTVQAIAVDENGNLQVDIVSGAGGYQYQDGATASGSYGNAVLGTDGNNLQILSTDTQGTLQVNITTANVDIRDLTTSTDAVRVGNGANYLAINTAGSAAIDIASVSVPAIPISANANTNTSANPIYVQQVSGVATNEVHHYNTGVGIGASITSTHTYSVATNTTFLLRSVIASASGAMKVEIKTGAVGNETTTVVWFTSAAKPSDRIEFNPAKEVAGAGNVLVVRRNDDNQAMDVYSTIIGETV